MSEISLASVKGDDIKPNDIKQKKKHACSAGDWVVGAETITHFKASFFNFIPLKTNLFLAIQLLLLD